jgi:hypothetical protein
MCQRGEMVRKHKLAPGLTGFEKIAERILLATDYAWRSLKALVRDMRLTETSAQAAITRREYEAMVAKGEAQVHRKLENLDKLGRRVRDRESNLRWLNEQKRICRKTGQFEGYYFDIVGVYDPNGVPKGEATVYRIIG